MLDGPLAKLGSIEMQTIKLINTKGEWRINCECDRGACIYNECYNYSHQKYLITSEYEDDSYWLCKRCLQWHFGAIDLVKQI